MIVYNEVVTYIIVYRAEVEDGTGSRRPLLGDAGVPPRLLYHFADVDKMV